MQVIAPQQNIYINMPRSGFIGGSDIPIILGLSSFKTPLQLWLEKTGQVTGDFQESEQIKWGRLLEKIIIQEFANRNNIEVEIEREIVHHKYFYLKGHLDGFLRNPKRVLEVKTVNQFQAGEWGLDLTDEIPLTYMCQVALYCSIVECDEAIIVVLIGGSQYREYIYKRDLDLENSILQKAHEFWEAITSLTPPLPINQQDINLMYPLHEAGKVKTLSFDAQFALADLHNARKNKKLAEAAENQYKFDLMKYMQDAEILADQDGRPLVTWKANKKGSRVFLVKEGKA